MRNDNYNPKGMGNFGGFTSMCIGIVRDNADPAQMGRLKVWIPSIDSVYYETEDLPWAMYVSPFGGVTADIKAGRESDTVPGVTAYGMWAIPKNGAQVLVGFLEGDPQVRFWLGCFYIPEMNHSMPGGVNGANGPTSNIDETNQYPQKENPILQKNLQEAGLGSGSKHHKTRGGYERSVAHPSVKTRNKPTDDGYATNPNDPEKADSQVVSLTTPGRHFMVMSDVDEHCRIRFKTAAGTQIIMDDTNERIYISTAQGRNYIELDETNGKMYFYTASKFNVHSENDINFYSDENINIVAKKRVNIQSEERGVKIQSKMGLQFLSTGGDIKITASRAIHAKTTNGANAGGVGESQSASQPPYANKPLGLIRDHAEEGGSGSSAIFINAANDVHIRSDGSVVNVMASGSLNLKSTSSVNIQATGTLNLNGGTIATKGAGVLGMFAGVVTKLPVFSIQNAGGAATASSAAPASTTDVKGKMVIPKHESWERDEDEGSVKTPRNKNYKG